MLTGIGNTTRTVDANGNTTSNSVAGTIYGFGYNGRNRMTVVQSSGSTVGTYTYNALGQRTAKVVTFPDAGSQRFTYDEASQLLGEYGSNSRDYIWLDDLPVATVDTSGTTSTISYVHADGLNTPRAITDSTGTTQWQLAYQGNPFSEQQPTSANGFVYNPRFAGQYYDTESGLANNINRDQEAATGRYHQPDPLGQAAGPSLFAYVSSNPLSFVDPLGLAKQDPNSLYCRQLAAKIGRVSKDLDKRWEELDADAGNLPEYLGPGEPFFATRRGHRTLINMADRNLRDLQGKYDDECGPPPPPKTCPAEDNQTTKAAETAAALTALYWIISEGSRLFPPRNLIPVP